MGFWVSASEKPKVKSSKNLWPEWAEFQGSPRVCWQEGAQNASRERHAMCWCGLEGPVGEVPSEEMLSSSDG